jgi:hypothetical protein
MKGMSVPAETTFVDCNYCKAVVLPLTAKMIVMASRSDDPLPDLPYLQSEELQ